MKVEANKVVTFHYTVSGETGKLESSRDREEPLAFLVGHGGLVPGLEKALDGRESGVDVIITNPDLVKTGLDMLEFPTIVFMQSGYNVYTLLQAARRSWRIGHKQDVRIYFLGYAGSAQMRCLALMAKKIAVSQSTSGDMPDSGLDVLNQGGDSVEVALAKELAVA